MAHLTIQNNALPPSFFDDLRAGTHGEGFAFLESGVVGEFAPAFEVRETPKELRIQADVPGVSARHLSIFLNGQRLTIWGRRERAREGRDLWFHAYERTYGIFWRTFRLTRAVDLASARAVLQRGVLTVSIRKCASDSLLQPGHRKSALSAFHA